MDGHASLTMGSMSDGCLADVQFDILWSQLTGMEHLWLFGVMKGLHASHIKEVSRKQNVRCRL